MPPSEWLNKKWAWMMDLFDWFNGKKSQIGHAIVVVLAILVICGVKLPTDKINQVLLLLGLQSLASLSQKHSDNVAAARSLRRTRQRDESLCST